MDMQTVSLVYRHSGKVVTEVSKEMDIVELATELVNNAVALGLGNTPVDVLDRYVVNGLMMDQNHEFCEQVYGMKVVYSRRRDELSVFNLEGKLLFSEHEEHLPINSHVYSIDKWYRWVAQNYSDVLADMEVM